MEGVLNIEDLVYVKIKFEDESADASTNLIRGFILEEGVACAVPLLQIQFSNMGLEYSRNQFALNDGTKCAITIGMTPSDAVEKKYRLFGTRQVQHTGGSVIHANFILDVPTYISGVYRESFDDISSNVMGSVAGLGGLGYEGPTTPTCDKQVWLNICQTRSAFAEDIALHGYQSDTSTMLRVVTSEKKLLYKNLFEELQKGEKATFKNSSPAGEGGANPINCSQIKPYSGSSVYNNWVNYGYTHTHHSLTGEQQDVKDFKAQKGDCGNLPINAEVKGKINDLSRIEYDFRLDCGNVHRNYVKAMYQNLRGRGVFSQRCYAVMGCPSGVNLLDPVKVYVKENLDDQLQEDRYINGKYLVTRKTIVLGQANLYNERIECSRPGVSVAGRTKLC